MLSPEQTKAALDELVQSDGWALVKQLATDKHNADAQLREFDAIMAGSPPSEIVNIQVAVLPQIRAAGKAVFALIHAVEAQQKALATAPAPAREDRFAQWRRTR